MPTTRTGPQSLRQRSAANPWVRHLLLLLAGAALVLPVEWVVHAASPTADTRAVVVESSVERRGSTGRVSYIHNAVAVTADGAAIDLDAAGSGAGALAELDLGAPVVITRSAADGRVLLVRAPQTVIDVENHWGAVVLRVGCLLVAGAALWLGWVAPRAVVVAFALMPLGAALVLVVLPRQHDIGAYPYPVRDAMQHYLDPPTATPSDPNRSTFRVDAVVPIGTAVPTDLDTTVTVTGPPRTGLPAGADPGIDEVFSTVRIPVRVEPAPPARRARLPTVLLLLGEGRGSTVRLDQEPACAGAPDAVPDRHDGPREGYVCYAVPDDFEARYLVLRNDDVAVDLRSAPPP
ncbi:hypothetical protein [Pseudonocardia humida]|uniref:Uncharacterized protein n=1 Tax=Pseudonocardia humida TaxID=2800819 RepID=A0ABT1A0G9_9PSEU|nr:hypothetical protein [Pseudonocardia humida]MCO1656506.1 hypothetical protein [Pseudonocardia humida]